MFVDGYHLPFLILRLAGLDSAAAFKVMMHLRAMASGPWEGQTVLASVHQPRFVCA